MDRRLEGTGGDPRVTDGAIDRRRGGRSTPTNHAEPAAFLRSTWDYDDAGRLLTQTDAKGQVTTLAYDPSVGRLATKTNLDGTVTYVYGEARGSYANVGRLTSVISPADVLETDYDELGRPVRLSRQMGPELYEVQKTYDGPSGALLTIVYPDGDSVGPMTYDEVGRVASIPGIVDLVTNDAA